MIDWRRSAQSDGHFVRQREWQAAQSVMLWVDPARSMAFSGAGKRPSKRDRAQLLALATAILLLRGGERVGLAYFGQINPTLLKLTGDGQLGFDWFLPPMVGAYGKMQEVTTYLIGPARRLTPGLYAVSATALRGLHWRFNDPASQTSPEFTWQSAWNAGNRVYSYFEDFEPIAQIGHSIYVYKLSAEDCARWDRKFRLPRVEK